MKNFTKILDALSYEGFKACIDYAAKHNNVQPLIIESADGIYFGTAFCNYLCWNSNLYNFYSPTSPYRLRKFPFSKDTCSYELHYTECVIKGKETYIKLAFNDDVNKIMYIDKRVIPKSIMKLITDNYTRFYSAKLDVCTAVMIYSEPYVLAHVMPTKMKEDNTK